MKKYGVMLGAEVTVKVPYKGTADQIRGTITAIDDKITVTEKLTEADEKAGKVARVMVIPKASSEVLAFHKNPNVPEATVEDGELIVNDNVIRTGFDVVDIVATLANRVYLTAAVENTDRVDIYSYNVAKDEFYKVTSTPLALDLESKVEIGTSVMIPYLNKHEEEEKTKDDAGNEVVNKYEVLEATGYVMISTVSTLADIVPTELGNSPILDSKNLGDNAVFFVTTTTIKTENSVLGRKYDDCDYDYDDDCDDEDDEYDEEYDNDGGYTMGYSGSGRIVPIEDGKIIIRAFRAEGRHLMGVGQVEMNGDYVSAIIAGRTAVIKTTKEIHVDVSGRIYDITDKAAVKALDGYNYVVKSETKNGVLKIWFTNDAAEVKVYSVTPAEDARGPIIEVQ